MKLCGEAWLSTGDPWVPEHDIEACMGMTCDCMQLEIVELDDAAAQDDLLPLPWAGAA